mmetsp:Transcript_5056/g.11834  ORF Transcript_5056/g.11834 Transcript_5056/m.11834 type:complete len:502 (-) Transcript_5056:632-2137(-)
MDCPARQDHLPARDSLVAAVTRVRGLPSRHAPRHQPSRQPPELRQLPRRHPQLLRGPWRAGCLSALPAGLCGGGRRGGVHAVSGRFRRRRARARAVYGMPAGERGERARARAVFAVRAGELPERDGEHGVPELSGGDGDGGTQLERRGRVRVSGGQLPGWGRQPAVSTVQGAVDDAGQRRAVGGGVRAEGLDALDDHRGGGVWNSGALRAAGGVPRDEEPGAEGGGGAAARDGQRDEAKVGRGDGDAARHEPQHGAAVVGLLPAGPGREAAGAARDAAERGDAGVPRLPRADRGVQARGHRDPLLQLRVALVPAAGAQRRAARGHARGRPHVRPRVQSARPRALHLARHRLHPADLSGAQGPRRQLPLRVRELRGPHGHHRARQPAREHRARREPGHGCKPRVAARGAGLAHGARWHLVAARADAGQPRAGACGVAEPRGADLRRGHDVLPAAAPERGALRQGEAHDAHPRAVLRPALQGPARRAVRRAHRRPRPPREAQA